MASVEYASLADVEARYEARIPANRVQWVQGLLNEAIDTLDGLMPTLRARWVSGEVSAALVRKVVVDAVLWVARAPQDQSDQLAAAVPSRQRPATNPNVISYPQSDLDLLKPADPTPHVGTARLALPAWRSW